MARANRVRGGGREGGIFHIAHRCHNREFLLRFARDRGTYREKLQEHAKKYEVWLLDYCITSNHVHLLLDAEERLEVSGVCGEDQTADPVAARHGDQCARCAEMGVAGKGSRLRAKKWFEKRR